MELKESNSEHEFANLVYESIGNYQSNTRVFARDICINYAHGFFAN